jgi:hypothetical protein
MLPSSNPPPKYSFARVLFSGARSYAEDFWVTVSRTAIAVFVLLLAFTLKPLIFDHALVIGEFAIPEQHKSRGISSETIGHQLFERIAEVQRVAKAAVAEKELSVQAFESNQGVQKLADVKLPGADVNIALMVNQLRSFFRIADTKISGELGVANTSTDPVYELRAYVSGTEMWSTKAQGATLQSVVVELADNLVEHFDPLSAGFFFLRRPLTNGLHLDHVIKIADQIQPKDQQEAVLTLTLRGMAWREKQKAAERTYASLCSAIAVDPSFTPAWRILAGALRDNGEFRVAKDLALRLIRAQPRDPEGLRQLAALYNDCVGDPGTPPAQRFFEQALMLGKGHGYLTMVDYARWLYGHFDNERPEYLDLAVDYFGRAQAFAPKEASIYTTFARALGHPRLRKDERPNEMAARYLTAEIKARTALALDEHSPFANFVMGELLTDEGVEAHHYKERAKFSEASPYLEKARAAASFPEPIYEAFFARAKAGQGDFEAAKQVVEAMELPPRRPSYLIQWVHGEILYNSRTDDALERERLLTEALNRLRQARSLHACGQRSNVISDLITRVENELQNLHPDMKVMATAEPHPDLSSDRSASDARRSLTNDPPKDWNPVCPGWSKADIDESAPFAPDPSLLVALPYYDSWPVQ